MGGLEQAAMYKLIALDLDGTLIGRDLAVSPRVREAIRQSIGAGKIVTIATGRMFRATLPFAQELALTAPLICYQGALVEDPVSREVIYHQPVPLEHALAVIQRVRSEGLHVNVYIDDELYVERLTPEAERYSRLSRVPVHAVGDLCAFLKQDPTKIVIVSDEPTTDRITAALSEAFGHALYVTKSYPFFCEIAHPDCSKANALALLARRFGIDRSEVVAVGDNLNDMDMIAWAGFGVAMGDASVPVKAVADFVTASLAEDGVAILLENLESVQRGVMWGRE